MRAYLEIISALKGADPDWPDNERTRILGMIVEAMEDATHPARHTLAAVGRHVAYKSAEWLNARRYTWEQVLGK